MLFAARFPVARRRLVTAVAVGCLTLGACAGSASDSAESAAEQSVPAGSSPLTGASTWQWQLQGELDSSHDVDVYNIDLFALDEAAIDALHDDGRTVICYFSAGSYEGWRPDAGGIDPAAWGKTLDGFEDERWLDVRDESVREVARARLDLAVAKGCDGVEPDNVDGYRNDTGLDLTAEDQLDFNLLLANEARARSLLVGLKNDLDQIPELVDHFDFAVNEQCHEYDECGVYAPFVEQDKPVFNAEYQSRFVDDPDEMCTRSRALGLRTLVLPLDLDNSFRISCDP